MDRIEYLQIYEQANLANLHQATLMIDATNRVTSDYTAQLRQKYQQIQTDLANGVPLADPKSMARSYVDTQRGKGINQIYLRDIAGMGLEMTTKQLGLHPKDQVLLNQKEYFLETLQYSTSFGVGPDQLTEELIEKTKQFDKALPTVMDRASHSSNVPKPPPPQT